MELSVFALFLAGLASFVSPCVLPLIPVYVFYLAGKPAKDMERPEARLIVNGLLFVAGFSIVFMLLGATATAFGKFLLANKQLIRYISGAVILFFGFLQTGAVNIRLFNAEKRFGRPAGTGLFSSLLMGAAFGFGWTPCIGYTLMPALMLAARQETVWQGVGLLGVYSLGMALPFVLLSFFLKIAMKWLDRIKKHMGVIKIVSGALIMAMGVLVLLGLV